MDADLNNQNASTLFFPFKAKAFQLLSESVLKQYIPDSSVLPDKSPESRFVVHMAFEAAESATEKSAAARDALLDPVSAVPESSA